MQELLFGTWGPQIAGFGRQIIAYSLQYPWRVFAGVLVVILLMDLMFRKLSAGDGIDGLDLAGETATAAETNAWRYRLALSGYSARIIRDPREHQPAAAGLGRIDQNLDRGLPARFAAVRLPAVS